MIFVFLAFGRPSLLTRQRLHLGNRHDPTLVHLVVEVKGTRGRRPPTKHVGLANSTEEALLQQLLGLVEVAVELGLSLGLVPSSFEGGQLSRRGREFLIPLLDHLLQLGVLSRHPSHLGLHLPHTALGLSSLLLFFCPLGHLGFQPLREVGVGSQRLLQMARCFDHFMLQPRFLLGMALSFLDP